MGGPRGCRRLTAPSRPRSLHCVGVSAAPLRATRFPAAFSAPARTAFWGTMLDHIAFHRHRSHQLPMSLGSTIITRFLATTDTLTPALAREPRVSVHGRSPWLLNMHFRTFRLQPPHAPLFRPCFLLRAGLTPDSRCCAIGGSSDFALSQQSRQSHKAESSSFRGFTLNPSVLRTIRSLSVALHPVSPRRSYFPLLAFSSAREGLPPSYARSIPRGEDFFVMRPADFACLSLARTRSMQVCFPGGRSGDGCLIGPGFVPAWRIKERVIYETKTPFQFSPDSRGIGLWGHGAGGQFP
jgi:hypothetical protein